MKWKAKEVRPQEAKPVVGNTRVTSHIAWTPKKVGKHMVWLEPYLQLEQMTYWGDKWDSRTMAKSYWGNSNSFQDWCVAARFPFSAKEAAIAERDRLSVWKNYRRPLEENREWFLSGYIELTTEEKNQALTERLVGRSSGAASGSVYL